MYVHVIHGEEKKKLSAELYIFYLGHFFMKQPPKSFYQTDQVL